MNGDTRIIQKKSLKGIMIFLLSKYVNSTHGYFTGVYSGKNQIQTNLWHGCVYKNLTDADRGWRADYNIVTANSHKKLYSEFFAQLFLKAPFLTVFLYQAPFCLF